MSRLSLPAHAGLLALALAACGPAPATRPCSLVPGSDSVVAPFAEATDAAWLGGDRWAVLLPGGPEADIVDFASRTRVPLGSKATLENPFSVFRATDTLFVAEPFKRRLTLWTLGGTFVRNEPASDLVRGALPRARDGAGHFYTELRPSAGPDGAAIATRPSWLSSTAPRSIPWGSSPRSTRQGGEPDRGTLRASGVQWCDRWGVYPDGTVWLARVYHNRVDFRLPNGKTEKGQPLPDRVLEVTRADRELFVRKFRRSSAGRGAASLRPDQGGLHQRVRRFRAHLARGQPVRQRLGAALQRGRARWAAPVRGRAARDRTGARRVTNAPACRRPDARGHSPSACTDASLSSDPFRHEQVRLMRIRNNRMLIVALVWWPAAGPRYRR